MAVKHRQAHHATHKVEIRQVVLGTRRHKRRRDTGSDVVCIFVCKRACTHGVDGGVGVDLQRVDVVRGVLEQAVIWVQHFMTQQVQPLPTDNHMVNKHSTLASGHVTTTM